jgi:hypothetical protein
MWGTQVQISAMKPLTAHERMGVHLVQWKDR